MVNQNQTKMENVLKLTDKEKLELVEDFSNEALKKSQQMWENKRSTETIVGFLEQVLKEVKLLTKC